MSQYPRPIPPPSPPTLRLCKRSRGRSTAASTRRPCAVFRVKPTYNSCMNYSPLAVVIRRAVVSPKTVLQYFVNFPQHLRIFMYIVFVKLLSKLLGSVMGRGTGDGGQELNDFCASSNVTGAIKSRRMRWVGNVARRGENTGATVRVSLHDSR